jgi:hypothetical protein
VSVFLAYVYVTVLVEPRGVYEASKGVGALALDPAGVSAEGPTKALAVVRDVHQAAQSDVVLSGHCRGVFTKGLVSVVCSWRGWVGWSGRPALPI